MQYSKLFGGRASYMVGMVGYDVTYRYGCNIIDLY